MKIKNLLMVATATASIAAAGAAMANQVVLKNATSKPLTISYKVARMNRGGPVIYDSEQTKRFNAGESLSLSIPQIIQHKRFRYVGVVPIKIKGQKLPPWVRQFDKPRRCSLTTDKQHPQGQLQIALGKHTLKCQTIGGVFPSG